MGRIRPTRQMGFFDVQMRLRSLDKAGDPLETLNRMIPWEEFRGILKKALRNKERKSEAGRPAFDEILMFKILVLQSLYNLADDRTEYQIKDRLSFMRFLDLGTEGVVPDAKTIWLYRNELAQGGWSEKLFRRFNAYLDEKGMKAEKGQIVDASFVEVPRQRNSREENEQIKQGETPKEWEKNVSKMRQKDVDARWTKKNEVNYYGYKNHVNIDHKNKLIRKYEITPASVHDSQTLEAILDENNTGKGVWADSAYKSEKIEGMLTEKGYASHVCEKGVRSHPLTKQQIRRNRARSKVRSRVEHVFGQMAVSMAAGGWMRAVGEVRIKMKIGMRNLTYNFWRFTLLMKSRKSTMATA